MADETTAPATESNLKGQMDGMAAEISRLEASVREATKEKEDVQQSLAKLEKDQKERAAGFESTMKSLRLDKDGQPLVNASLANVDPIFKTVEDALEESSVESLKSLVKELGERLFLQHAKNKKLTFELEMECGHVNILRAENQALKKQAVSLQAEAEREEEFITNRLMQRINNLKKEKGELLMKVEQEEEQITNALQRKLSQLQREKIEMEQALEQEQEFIVNRLQRQLELLRLSQPTPNSSSTSPAMKKYPTHTPPSSDYPPSPTISPGIIEVMRAEVNALKLRMHDLEKDYEENSASAREIYAKCRSDLVELRTKLGMPIDQIDQVYPAGILPALVVPGSPAFAGDFSSRPYGLAGIGSLERRSRGSLVGSQHELGNWPRNDKVLM
ncbi:hypothetical protein HDU67_004254 [Dinochytrium kinnereticum]|nr:hypothetical protein HDU67_004254 [Dinochytrium kinnereticum]